MKDLKLAIHKELQPNMQVAVQLHKLVRTTTIEKSIKGALSTGNWNLKRSTIQTEKRQGVAQVLSRMTYIATLSHLRRINTPMENKSGKLVRPRQLHCSHKGFVCPAETPEGQPVGLVKNLAVCATLSVGSSAVHVQDRFWQHAELLQLQPLPDAAQLSPDFVFVFLNGKILGVVPNMDAAVSLRAFVWAQRRCGTLPFDLSCVVHYDKHEVFLYTDAGRSLRAVLVCNDHTVRFLHDPALRAQLMSADWTWLLFHGIVEYIDAEESETLLIAPSVQHLLSHPEEPWTHCDIHPTTMLGVVAAMIPFANHNQSPRLAYQSAMGKQCISQYVLNSQQRMDTISNIMLHVERPLVSTRIAEHLKCNELPYGQNMLVAFLIHTGYNEEDAFIVNHGALQRGLMHAISYKTYKSEERKHVHNTVEEKFCRPDQVECKGRRFGSFDKLDDRGIVKEGSVIDSNDVIIGKVTPQSVKNKKQVYRDASVTVKPSDVGTVDKVFLSVNGDGYKIAKVRVRADRVPVLGDKFAARYGQKGTVGMLLPQEDMPFLQDGTPLDMLINPHSIPSRMTIGMLLEILVGKVSTQTGVLYDSTPFETDMPATIDTYTSLMHQAGFHMYGAEKLYNGVTGELMDALVFAGPCYYQRLKHMVEDKMHSRSKGPVTPLTRQPCEGRSRSGGLRVGEMERDVLLAHGVSGFLLERMFHCSDEFYAFVCDHCGLIAPYADSETTPDIEVSRCCKPCQNYTSFSKVAIPYASKLLFQELMSMGIVPRIQV